MRATLKSRFFYAAPGAGRYQFSLRRAMDNWRRKFLGQIFIQKNPKFIYQKNPIQVLQNRVDPYGNIIRTNARGAWMGNRGLLHNENKNILRPYKIKAWITCLLEFKGRKRVVMSPNLYTELFFFDEATSLAAGHRPCFECRRADALRFKSFWLRGNPEYGFNEKVLVQKIDEVLHRERIDGDGAKVTYEDKPGTLPDGTFIELSGKPFLIANGYMHQWSPSGYLEKKAIPLAEMVRVLTPKSIVNTLRAGYLPTNGLRRLIFLI